MAKKLILSYTVLFVVTAALYALDSFDGILVGGVYRIELNSGQIFEGFVDEKDDSSLIIESMGTPYKFKATLIYEYTLITPPKKNLSADGPDLVSFEELLHRSSAIGRINILITNGTIFKGVVSAIDSGYVHLDVDGSVVPIARDLITKVTRPTIPAKKKADLPGKQQSAPEKPQGPFDTVYVQNTEFDDQGNRLAPLVIIGKIYNHDAKGIVIATPAGSKRGFKNDRILRVIRKTTTSYEQQIQTYAKTLFCAPNMALVDVPPGREGRPFFKVCIDRYEYPNQQGSVPQVNVSYNEAAELCHKLGKRLCSVDEWQWSCSGLEGFTYPYGFRLEKTYCNREGAQQVEPSGARNKCVGKFGVYDMVGNIFEWVTDSTGNPMLMGGPYSTCQAVSPGLSGAAKPQIGFRCCKSN